MSKHQHRVLRGLRRRALSTAQIIERYHCMRPASVIQYLREQGHNIVTLRQPGAGMAVYVLIGEAA